MKLLRIGSCLMSLLFVEQAMARNFYKTGFSFSAEYSSFETGTRQLFSDRARVRYSDDRKFCAVDFGGARFDCTVAELRFGAAIPKIAITPATAQSLFLSAANRSSLSSSTLGALRRLTQRQLKGFALTQTQGFFRQLHDENPESVHVKVSPLSSPVRY